MKNKLSARQLAVTSFTALLAPAAVVAGLDWRGALLAVPVILLVAWCWSRLGMEMGGWVGYWRGWSGKLLSLFYMVWMLLLSGAILGTTGNRITAPQGEGAGWVVVLVWIPVFLLVKGKPEAFGRAAEIFYLAMGAVLVFVLLLGVVQIKWERLMESSGLIWESFFRSVGVGCYGVAAVLLWHGEDGKEKQRWITWSVASAVALLLMSVVTVGILGPNLAASQERPFFIMTVGLGKTARVEGLLSVLWLFADVTFVGLLLQSIRKLWTSLDFPWKSCEVWLPALLVLGVALWWGQAKQAEKWLYDVLPISGLVVGAIIPMLACMKRKWQQKERSQGYPKADQISDE